MKRIIMIALILPNLFFYNISAEAGKLTVTAGNNNNFKKAYFAGGCFWCMEESFDKVKGVIESISGYSGGSLQNPSYKDVIYKDTGHVETIEVIYDPNETSFKKLLNVFWKNIDPFDSYGQFCDKGKSYRSVAFFQDRNEKKIITKSIQDLENKFENEIVTLVWKFDKFYKAEDYHQDYYQKNFLKYLAYKKACQREEVLNKIWN